MNSFFCFHPLKGLLEMIRRGNPNIRASRLVDLLLEYRDTIFNTGKGQFKDKNEHTKDHSEIYPA